MQAVPIAPPPVSRDLYRAALGTLASGVTIITIRGPGGAPYGVTATSFGALSLDPPLVQWSLRREAWSHDEMTSVERFGVSILAADQEWLARRFATPGIDRFAGIEAEGPAGDGPESGPEGPPFLPGAQAWIDCATETLLPGGDHTIVVGRVLSARIFDRRPLLHWRGAFLPV